MWNFIGKDLCEKYKEEENIDINFKEASMIS